MFRIQTAVVAGLFLLVAGCGGGSSNSDSPLTGQALSRTSIEGEWVSKYCNQGVFFNGEYYNLWLEQGNFEFSTHVYKTSSCAQPRYSVVKTGTYDVIDASTEAKFDELDITSTSINVTIFDPADVQDANQSAHCEKTDWIQGVNYDVTTCRVFIGWQAHGADNFPHHGHDLPITNYDLFNTDNNQLAFNGGLDMFQYILRPNSSHTQVSPPISQPGDIEFERDALARCKDQHTFDCR